MLEMWDLYNDKREKTGKVLPRGVPVPKGLYHLTVSAWIVNSQGQYLLSPRWFAFVLIVVSCNLWELILCDEWVKNILFLAKRN